MKVQFKQEEKSPTIEVANGSYKRIFNRAEQPFDVTADEWALIAPTGLFEQAPEKKPKPPTTPPTTDTPGTPEQK